MNRTAQAETGMRHHTSHLQQARPVAAQAAGSWKARPGHPDFRVGDWLVRPDHNLISLMADADCSRRL